MRAILLGIGSTCRFEVVAGAEYLEAARREKRPLILSLWHNRSFLAAYFVYSELSRRGFEVLVLASQSRDGELVTRLARQLRLSVVRGSASRGGLAAMRAIYRAIARQGLSPVLIPDGPRGPLYELKVGVAVLAQMSQVPILPIGLAAQRFFTLGSWDRLIVPWPFSRVAVVIGEPQTVERGLSSDELESRRRGLEALLVDLTRRAEERLGARDRSRSS